MLLIIVLFYIAVYYYLLNICAYDLFTTYLDILYHVPICTTRITEVVYEQDTGPPRGGTDSLSYYLSLCIYPPLYDFSHFHFCFFILFLRKLSRADVVIK